jgi:hypothetical protein
MYSEITISKETKLILYQNYDFWNKVISENIEPCDDITIITYNFNFTNYGKNSFFELLISLLEKGCNVRLIYSKSNGTNEINGFINKFGIISECKDNHSKIFFSNKFAYMGSSNFSYGSNNNIENGFITTNKKIVSQFNKFVLPIYSSTALCWKVIPEIIPVNDEMKQIQNCIEKLETLRKKIEDKKRVYFTFIEELHYRVTGIGLFKTIFESKYLVESYIELLYLSYSLKNHKSKEKHNIELINEIIKALEDYKSNIEYTLCRGGVLRLYYENGDISDEEMETLFNKCDGNEVKYEPIKER